MSKIEKVGKVIVGGFGDKVLLGVLIGFLNNVTPHRCYEFIKSDKELFGNVADSNWQRLHRIAENIDIDTITTEAVMRELEKHRLDILGVILNHPKGEDWLGKQVEIIKKKLII